MSNAVDLFRTSRPSLAFQTLDPSTESLADGIGASYGVINYKGKVWSLKYKGQQHVFTRSIVSETGEIEDGDSPSNFIDVIVLRQAQNKSRSFYPVYKDGSDGERPLCASMNYERPDNDVRDKQAEICQLCPKNIWKTGENGRRSKECKDYKRLAVMLHPKHTARMLGESLIEPVFLRIPGDSLGDMAAFGDMMSKRGWHYSTFVMRISFDPKESYPKYMFKELKPLGDAEAKIILELREDAVAKRITGETVTISPIASEFEKAVPQSIGLIEAVASKPTAQVETRNEPSFVDISEPSLPDTSSLDARIAELMRLS